MNRKITFALGEYYHIYNRGVEKRKIFITNKDYKRFLSLLYLSNGTQPIVYNRVRGGTLYETDIGEKLVAIGAYVLMPNHFHLLIKETSEKGITEFMRKLTTAYSMYFNKINDRVGPLFQGTFKAEYVDNDEYLKYLFAYIHLNPIKLIESKWKEEGIKNLGRSQDYLDEYAFSSFQDFCGIERKEKTILSTEVFPGYFVERQTFKNFIKDMLMYEVEPRTKRVKLKK